MFSKVVYKALHCLKGSYHSNLKAVQPNGQLTRVKKTPLPNHWLPGNGARNVLNGSHRQWFSLCSFPSFPCIDPGLSAWGTGRGSNILPQWPQKSCRSVAPWHCRKAESSAPLTRGTTLPTNKRILWIYTYIYIYILTRVVAPFQQTLEP